MPQICPSVLLCGAVQGSPSPQRAADCAVKGPKSSIDLGLVERFAVTLMSRGKGMLLGGGCENPPAVYICFRLMSS